MIKKGQRYCDRCGNEMPNEPGEKDNPHNIIKLAIRKGSCQINNWSKDICTDCADLFDAWWKEGGANTKKRS